MACMIAVLWALPTSATDPVTSATVSSSGQRLPCLDASDVDHNLRTQFGETVGGRGVASPSSIWSLYISPSGATWTIIVTLTNGLSCFVAAGEYWQRLSPTTTPPEVESQSQSQ